jgi:hypothetical protein
MEIIAVIIAICIVASIVQAAVNLNSSIIIREARIVCKYESGKWQMRMGAELIGDLTSFLRLRFSIASVKNLESISGSISN